MSKASAERSGKNIYVLPPLVDFSQKKFRIFFLPDGNERAKRQASVGYKEGGKKVVKIIEALAKRDDVSEATFAILSKENIEKRTDEFFHELYVAFLALGVAMERDGVLINSGIDLEVDGDLEFLKRRSETARSLAEMIEEVVAKTKVNNEPKVKIKFGVNYDEQTLTEAKVDLVFRTGMERPNMFRSSGLAVGPEMVCLGMDDLFPTINVDLITRKLAQMRSYGHRYLEPAHDGKFVENLLHKFNHIPNCNVDLPIDVQKDIYQEHVEKMVLSQRKLLEFAGLSMHDQHGRVVHRTGNRESNFQLALRAVSDDVKYVNGKKYDFMVAPGQTGGRFILPAQPRLHYATVCAAEYEPEEICSAIADGVRHLLTNPPLYGSQRLAVADLSEGFGEFDIYSKLERQTAGEKGRIEEIAANMDGDPRELTPEFYMKVADLFVAKFLAKARQRGARFDTEIQMRALINYIYTSVFMTYFPNHQDWAKYDDNWELRAEGLALYMEAVFFVDEIFAFVVPAKLSGAKVLEIQKALVDGINGGKPNYVETGNAQINDYLKAAQNALAAALDIYKNNSSQQCLKEWQERFANLIENNVTEFFYTTESETDHLLNKQASVQKENSIDEEIERRFINPYVPGLLKQKIMDEAGKLPLDENARINLDFLFYLTDIGNSIGSDLTYRSIACVGSRATFVPLEFKDCFEELCFTVNVYYRAANDLADVYRPENDRDKSFDSYTILSRKYPDLSPAAKRIKVIAELSGLMKEAKDTILTLADRLTKLADGAIWEEVAISVLRSQIGELFYTGTHYRLVKRHTVAEFFGKMYGLGTISVENAAEKVTK